MSGCARAVVVKAVPPTLTEQPAGQGQLIIDGLVEIGAEGVDVLLYVVVFAEALEGLAPAGAEPAIQERVTQQDIADMIGASRAMVGRILKDLVAGGYVTHDAGRLVIHKRLPPRW